MPKDRFDFKQFTILQDRCAMKVSTDGMILGAWAGLPEQGTLLDLGCGTGVLSLMAAQRFPGLHIDALDIDLDSARQAQENIAGSPWSDRIRVIPSAVQAWHGGPYDAIISNPPFFGGFKSSPDAGRKKARYGEGMLPDDLALHLSRLLAPRGSAHLVLPFDPRWEAAFSSAGLFVYRALCVSPSPVKPVKRMYLALSHKPCAEPEVTTLPLQSSPGGAYSDWFRELTEDFYLPQKFQGKKE